MLGLKSNATMKAEFEQLAMPCLDGLYASALRLTHTATTSTGVIIATYEPAGPVPHGSYALDES